MEDFSLFNGLLNKYIDCLKINNKFQQNTLDQCEGTSESLWDDGMKSLLGVKIFEIHAYEASSKIFMGKIH